MHVKPYLGEGDGRGKSGVFGLNRGFTVLHSSGVMTYPFSKQQIWGVCFEGSCVTSVPKPVVSSMIK